MFPLLRTGIAVTCVLALTACTSASRTGDVDPTPSASVPSPTAAPDVPALTAAEAETLGELVVGLADLAVVDAALERADITVAAAGGEVAPPLELEAEIGARTLALQAVLEQLETDAGLDPTVASYLDFEINSALGALERIQAQLGEPAATPAPREGGEDGEGEPDGDDSDDPRRQLSDEVKQVGVYDVIVPKSAVLAAAAAVDAVAARTQDAVSHLDRIATRLAGDGGRVDELKAAERHLRNAANALHDTALSASSQVLTVEAGQDPVAAKAAFVGAVEALRGALAVYEQARTDVAALVETALED